jgi:hypothetical protein
VPTTTAAILAGCANPTFSSDGTDTLALTDPQPPACDQQGASPCITIGVNFGPTATTTLMSASPSPATAGQPVTLAYADAGSGYGTSTLGADLTLAVPAATAAGPYSGSLTVTAITAYP